MNTKKDNSFLFLTFLLTVLFGSFNPTTALEGPTKVIPGNYHIDDTDPGNGEQWGRPGGRTLTFSNFELDELAQLLWGVTDANSVIITFDGDADEDGENNLSYTIYSTQGYIEWNGQTQVELFSEDISVGMYDVDTKFRLTIKDHTGNPVSFVNNTITGLPQVDVYNLPLNPQGYVTFSATLEMFAKNPSDEHSDVINGITPTPEGQFGPALDVFDCLHTNPIQNNTAITSFDWSFFFEPMESRMTIEWHDEHIAGLFSDFNPKLNTIYTNAQYFYEDWPLKFEQTFENQSLILSNLGNAVFTLNQNAESIVSIDGNTQQLPERFNELSLKLDNFPFSEIMSQLGNIPNHNLMLLLFGIEGMMPEEDPNLPGFDVIQENSFLYQSLTGIDSKADQLVSNINLIQADLGNKITMVDGKVDGITTAINSLNNGMINAITTVNEEVITVKENIDALTAKIDLIQTEITDNRLSEITLEVVKNDKKSANNNGKNIKLDLIVLLKENGKSSNAALVAVEGIVETENSLEKISLPFEPVTISDGIVSLTVTLNKSQPLEALIISAEHEIEEGIFIYGTSIFSVN